MNGDKSALHEFGKRWAEAELARDLTVLDALAHRDFMLGRTVGIRHRQDPESDRSAARGTATKG